MRKTNLCLSLPGSVARAIALALLLLSLPVSAENYPYRSDYLFTTIPNHSDWLYKTGESAQVEVIFQHYGVAKTIECEYSVANDMMPHTQFKKMTLKDGRGTINIGTRKTPGFTDLLIRANIPGSSRPAQHHIKLGYDVDKIKAWTQEPADFTSFWANVLQQQAKQPLSYTKELAKEYCTDKFDCYLVKLQILDNHAFYGYLFMPKNADCKRFPVVLCPPGAGVKTIKEPLRHRYYADNGMIRFEIDIHGLNPTMTDREFKEISNAFGGNLNGYLTNRLEDPDRYYMRHVYAGLVRCFDFLTSLPEWDGKNCAVQGGSQGGALAIVAAALDKRVNICVANHPALADMGAYSEEGRTGGYPHLKDKVSFSKENLRTLALYDVVNFAKHVSADFRMTWGYNDNTCPPTTSYAVWNNIPAAVKQALITPVNEHWTSEQTEYEHMTWIKSRLK